jgi:hypothetical protein
MRRVHELINRLQAGADDPMWAEHCEMGRGTCAAAAALLREQAAEIERLTSIPSLVRGCDALGAPTTDEYCELLRLALLGNK